MPKTTSSKGNPILNGTSTSHHLGLVLVFYRPPPSAPATTPTYVWGGYWLVLSLVVMKLPYLFSTILVPELSKGMGHNSYGEPAWPNDILYIFPIVIFGIRSYILGLAILEPLNISSYANPFGTPFQILAEWYLFPTLHLLRILSDKFMGILSMLAVPTVLLLIPFGENLSRYQNPIRRPIMVSIFLSALIYSIWLSCISLKLTG